MLTLRTEVEVERTARAIYDFLINCTTEEYQKWWEGTHPSVRGGHSGGGWDKKRTGYCV